MKKKMLIAGVILLLTIALMLTLIACSGVVDPNNKNDKNGDEV